MRTLMGALVLDVALSLGGCKKPVAEEPPPEEVPPAATPAPAVKPATPETKPVVMATPPPPVATPELAPPGIFYLVTAVSVETSDGILGLKPGQLLHEVRPGVYKVENNELTLRPDQVTNDLAIARRVAVQDQRIQAAIQQQLSGPAHSAVPPASGSAAPGGQHPPASQPVNPNVQARAELNRQREANLAQSNRLAASLSELSTRFSGSWELAAKKSPQAFQLLQQYRALEKQRAEIDAQISQLR